MVFGRRKKQQSSSTVNSHLSATPQKSCLKKRGGGGGGGSSQGTNQRHQHHVQFGPVRIREYERVIGCNPSCSNGAPIGIGWRYVDNDPPLSIVTMERNPNRRQHKADLVLSRHEREALLLEWGFTLPEIVDSIRAIVRIKHQRRRTVNNARYERVWEDVVVKPATRIKKKFRRSSQQQQQQNALLHEETADYHDRMMEAPVDFRSVIDSSVCCSPPNMPRRSVEETEMQEFEDDPFFVMDDDPVVYVYEQEEISSAGTATIGSDGNFDLLARDTSYWELERNNVMYPKISRKALAIVVSEEPGEDYSALPPTLFPFNAPPHLSTIHPPLVSRWD